MAREDQGIGDHDILPTSRGEDDHFRNVIRGKRLTVSAATYRLAFPSLLGDTAAVLLFGSTYA